MLLKLPVEILDLVIDQIPGKSDLKHLSEVSTYLRSVTIPKMYESITLRAIAVPPSIPMLGQEKLLHFNCRNNCRLIRNLQFVGSFKKGLFDNTNLELEHDLKHFFGLLQKNRLKTFLWDMDVLMPPFVLKYLNVNQSILKELSIASQYNSSDYIEGRALERSDLSTFRHLRKIRVLSMQVMDDLETVRKCLEINVPYLKEVELYAATTGIFMPRHLPKIIAWSDTYDLLFGISAVDLSQIHHLSLGWFGFLSPWGFGQPGQNAIDISNLRSLTLTDCHTYLELFASILHSKKKIQLTSLNIAQSVDFYQGDEGSKDAASIAEFLKAFSGLESFCVMIPDLNSVALGIFQALGHQHASTLTRIIYHEEQTDYFEARTVDDESDEEGSYDTNSDNENDDDGGEIERDATEEESAQGHDTIEQEGNAQKFCNRLNVECVGVYDIFSRLERYIREMGDTPGQHSLKLLHLRRPGEDYETDKDYRFAEDSEHKRLIRLKGVQNEFSGGTLPWDEYGEAQLTRRGTKKVPSIPKTLHLFLNWIFGPRGLQQLKIVAYGDFSYHARYNHQTQLFVRRLYSADELDEHHPLFVPEASRFTYHFMTANEMPLWRSINQPFEFLKALPGG